VGAVKKKKVVLPEGQRQFVNEQVIATTFGRALQTLRSDRHKRRGFPYYKFGRSCLYDLNECYKLMDAHRIDLEVK
jgi:hypothetical protein